MVTAINPQPATSQIDKIPNPARPPHKDHTHLNRANGARQPRGKQVPSRYLSPSPSPSTSSSSSSSSSSSTFPRRFASPLVSRSSNSGSPQTPAPKRSQSVDRRRPVAAWPRTPNPEQSKQTQMPAATRMLITSTRSLSVSFQGESFSLPVSKAKAVTPQSPGRKHTPERKRVTPVRDHLRWPARTREGNLSSSMERNHLMSSRSFDCSVDEDKRLVGSGLMVARSLQQSMILDETSRRLSLDLGSVKLNPRANSEKDACCSTGDLTESDSDSVSSGSTSGVQDFGGISRGKIGPRGIIMSSRVWQEKNSRLRRIQDPGSPLSKRFTTDGSLLSPRLKVAAASPIRGATRPASPVKLRTSSASSPAIVRGMASPTRARTMSSSPMGIPSILSFSVDLRRGKIGEDRINYAHTLRLLYNRYLQWRFVNARAEATFMVQKLNAEKNMWNAWLTISELRHSVTVRRVKLLLLTQKLKLTSILKGQINFLEEWSVLERDQCTCLDGTTESLKATTLRLPIVGKAIVDVQNLKDAVGSAVDIMQAMVSSICSQLSKYETHLYMDVG
ncbi:QWRF motif-containing protein 2 [Linum perenne]